MGQKNKRTSTNSKTFQERLDPEQSSMKADRSKGHLTESESPDHFVYKPHLKDDKQVPPGSLTLLRERSKSLYSNVKSEEPVHQQTGSQDCSAASGPTCLSMKTERSISEPIEFKAGGKAHHKTIRLTSIHEEQEGSGEEVSAEKQLYSTFMELKKDFDTFTNDELQRLKNILSPESSGSLRKDPNGTADEEEQIKTNRDAFLKILLNFLRNRKEEMLADSLQEKTHAMIYQQKLKSQLKRRFQCICEETSEAGRPTFVSQVYTKLYITEHGRREVNGQHEVQQIEAAFWNSDDSKTIISCEDIFKPRGDEPIRTLMTKGVAGIGKTVLTQKYILDWTKDNANQSIQFMFPFTFRELNLLRGQTYSLVELIHYFFSDIKEAGICRFDEFQVVFIFDGLDECRLPLDFHNTQILTDVTESTSVDVLIINLIRGRLLPSAHLWITTRPLAANQIPPECVDMVTEVRGFKDPEKEEYFKKRFRDEEQATRIISHIGTSRSLHIMCHIPVFCWITATVLDQVLKNNNELPKTLTELYIHFLQVQAQRNNTKYHLNPSAGPIWNKGTKKIFLALGELSFKQLEKGNLMFYEEDLQEYGIDVTTASNYSGMFTEIFREEFGLNQEKVFCFVHLSIQEFLAALYVFLMFMNSGVNLMTGKRMTGPQESKNKKFYQSAVDKALQSPNGHLDLFVRFLLGLSLTTNQNLLQGLVKKTRSKLQVKDSLVEYIKKKIRDCPSTERSIRMFHWLNELNDRSLEEEIQTHLRETDFVKNLTPSQWRALTFILLSSQKDLETFNLKKFSASKEALMWLHPVVKASKTSLLNGCNLPWRSCIPLVPVLTAENSCLRELDLSNNDLYDTGVNMLSQGLRSPKCRLEVLRLSGCQVTHEGCQSLASALSSNPSHLRELDLSFNHPGPSGLDLLSDGLKDPNWKLETLKTDHCGKSRLSPSPQRFFCELTLDPNTANRNLQLSEDIKHVEAVKEKQQYPDQPERFEKWKQLLCGDGFSGHCYWEVRWKGNVRIGVTYKRIKRKGKSDECCLGWNDHSWSLFCTSQGFTAWHNNKGFDIKIPQTPDSDRIAVYLDWSAGTLSYYCLPKIVSSIQKIHLHTFQTTFTEPVYPAFGFGETLSSLILTHVD